MVTEVSKDAFRDPAIITRLTQAALWVHAVLGVATLGALLYERYLWNLELSGAGFSDEQADLGATFLSYTLELLPATFLISGILSLVFIYQANRNARRLGADLDTSAAWAVGSFFVPFVNLWVPYQALKEIWQASEDPKNWRRMDGPGILPIWFSLHVISAIASWFMRPYFDDPDGVDAFLVRNAIFLVLYAFDVATTVLFHLVVTRIHHMQTGHAAGKSYS